MARPRKFATKEEEDVARTLSQSLFREIENKSDLSSSKIAKALEGEFEISAELWRQYANGNRILGFEKQALLIGVALNHAWIDIAFLKNRFQVERTLLFSTSSESLLRLNATYGKWQEQLLLSSIKNLRSAFQHLIALGWSDADLVASAIILTEELMPAEQRTTGGLISPQQIQKQLGMQADQPKHAWLNWSMNLFGADAEKNSADQ